MRLLSVRRSCVFVLPGETALPGGRISLKMFSAFPQLANDYLL